MRSPRTPFPQCRDRKPAVGQSHPRTGLSVQNRSSPMQRSSGSFYTKEIHLLKRQTDGVLRCEQEKKCFISPVEGYFDGMSRFCFNDPFTVQRIFVIAWPSGRQNDPTGGCQMSAAGGCGETPSKERSSQMGAPSRHPTGFILCGLS